MARTPAEDAADVARLRAEVKRLEQELAGQLARGARMEEAVVEFLGTVAHDLKNPLAAIKIGVQGFRRSLERAGSVGKDEGDERLARIDRAVEHAKEVIAEARARALEGAVSPPTVVRQPVDLVVLIRDALEPFETHVGPQRLKLSRVHDRLAASVDAGRVRRCVAEVVDNALKFSDQASRVTISLGGDGPTAVISCRDEGIGIPAADLPHIGERFYRAENVLGRYKGAGLGLFEAMGTVLAHSGHLVVESVEGSGTLVTISLPLE